MVFSQFIRTNFINNWLQGPVDNYNFVDEVLNCQQLAVSIMSSRTTAHARD